MFGINGVEYNVELTGPIGYEIANVKATVGVNNSFDYVRLVCRKACEVPCVWRAKDLLEGKQ